MRYWPPAQLVAPRSYLVEREFQTGRASVVRRQTMNFELVAEPHVRDGDSSGAAHDARHRSGDA